MINGSLSIGAFTAFYAYLLMLISPMRTLGYMLSGAAQRATASGRPDLPGARPRAAHHGHGGRAAPSGRVWGGLRTSA